MLTVGTVSLTGCDDPKPSDPTPSPTPTPGTSAKPLKIIYSDWPGWVAWEIAIQKNWFEEEGIAVEFEWTDYVEGMTAYASNKGDAVCMTNGDMLVTGATGKKSTAIIINDYSNGNDMLIAAPGIESLTDLKGKKIGVETGYVSHLLLLHALKSADMTEKDVVLENMATNETPNGLASGAVSAISAWQPNSGQALKIVAGSKALYTSAEAPGIIYDCLCVSRESLAARKDDWAKVVKVWYRTVDYIKDEKNRDDVLKILSARVGLKPNEYAPLLKGTYLLSLDEVMKVWEKADGIESVYGSSTYVDEFNVDQEVYKSAEFKDTYFDASLTRALNP